MQVNAKEAREARWKAERRLENEKHIRDQNSWPLFPYLPMKRRKANGEFPDCALLVSGKGLTVFKISIDELPGSSLDKVPQEQFLTLDALLDAGWEVD